MVDRKKSKMHDRWLHAGCVLLLGGFLLISCKKEACKPKNYENENCYSQQECDSLSHEVITYKLIGKWKVTEFVKDGENIKENVGDKLEFCCFEFSSGGGLCMDGELKLKTNLLKKHKATWIYKGWVFFISGESNKFPDEYDSSFKILKLTEDELEIGSTPVWAFTPQIVLKRVN